MSEIVEAGVDISAMAKIAIGVGDGTDSGQTGDGRDILYIDNICLVPEEIAEAQ